MSNRTTHRRAATRQQLTELLALGVDTDAAIFTVTVAHRCRRRAAGRRG